MRWAALHMNADIFSQLEKSPYPAAVITPMGENLRAFTKNETAFVPPVWTAALTPSSTFPICVPTTRHILKNRKNFRRIMQLAADSENTLLIFLCSGLAKKDHIEVLAQDFPNLQWMAIDGPFNDSLGTPPFITSISPLSYGGDLAQKRNFVLHLAKLMRWESVFLLDDDILITKRQIKKTRTLLAKKNVSIVGFNARSFPDNSVAVHVHRWIHGSMDSFLGGGVLAIKLDTPFMSFFPRIYNEDWVFMLIYRLIGEGNIVWADTVKQRPYNPYKTTSRAINEEAGDIIGESLARLMHVLSSSDKHYKTPDQLTAVLRTYANENFWDTEINNRLDYLYKLSEGLQKKRLRFYRRYQAKRAIKHSIKRILGTNGHPPITGKQIAEWVDAWCKDLEHWNTTLTQSAPCETLADALRALSIPSESIVRSADIETVSQNAPPKRVKHSPRQYIYEGHTVRPRSQTILENLWLAKSVEEYLADKDLSIKKTASSANMLRFDRPTHWITDIKPEFTVSVMVAYGEPVAQIHQSILNIIAWSKDTGPLQLLIWVYNDSGRDSSKNLELYRNRLIAQLVHDIQGTHIQLRSGIIAKTSNIQDVISQSLDDISFAYWKQKIKAKHPIYVVNSQNELLRLGTFCQFMHHEQLLPRRSLKYHIRKHIVKNADFRAIPKESDIVSLRVSRESLTLAPQRQTSMKATKAMLRYIHKARLTWISVDDLAYSIVYHHTTGEDSLEHSKKIICIPVEYGTTPIRDFTSIFAHSHGKDTAYFVVIHGTTNHSWDALDAYHDEVLSRLTAIYPQSIIFSTAYRLAPGESKKYFRRRVEALARYAKWLQNHDDKPGVRIVK